MLWLWLRLLRQGGFSLWEGAFEETALLSIRWLRGYRFGGSPPCSNRSVRADQLEEELSQGEVRAVLEDPSRVWKVSIAVASPRTRDGASRHARGNPAVDRQSAAPLRPLGIERLIDSYAEEGVIEKSEFTPRINANLEQRLCNSGRRQGAKT